MTESHRRHDISDKIWELLASHLPGREGVWGGIAKDNRLFINAVFWILCTGASAVGATRESGRISSTKWLTNRIANG